MSMTRLQDTIDDLKSKALTYVETLQPIHGKDGRDGIDGANGKDGMDGLRGIDGQNGTDGLCGAKGEPGEPGKDGESGRDGRDGLPGVQGPAGLDGKDGVNGKDGANGLDGFGFDDLVCSYDGARTITIAFVQAERTKEFSFRLPFPLDKGVYRPGTAYECGDNVTFGGSSWNALTDQPEGEPGLSKDWRLVAKRGREGRPGERGAPGKDGQDGRPGKDLTQLGPDGSKW
jgi:integrin beta 3